MAALGDCNYFNYFDALSDTKICQKIMNAKDSQAISNIANAFAHLAIEDNSNFFLAFDGCKNMIEKWDAQAVCNCLWSFASLGLLAVKEY